MKQEDEANLDANAVRVASTLLFVHYYYFGSFVSAS